MNIREFQQSDLARLIDLTVEAFRPLYAHYWPALISPDVFAHDHGDWQADYRHEVPMLHDPGRGRVITVAEEGDSILGYVGWEIKDGDSGRLEMVAVHPHSQRRGVGRAICLHVLDSLRREGAAVVHIGTGGDDFHAPARQLYESLGFNGLPIVDYTRAL